MLGVYVPHCSLYIIMLGIYVLHSSTYLTLAIFMWGVYVHYTPHYTYP